jgi:hypothetical protein
MANISVPDKGSHHTGRLTLSGNLGEDSRGINPQNGAIAVIQPPSQVRHGALISQSRDGKVGAVGRLDRGEWTRIIACDAGHQLSR